MNLEEKKMVSQHLIEEINRTGISTRLAGEWLGMQPCYVSMAKNPDNFDSMSRSAWNALEKWHLSREPLDSYKTEKKESSGGRETFDPPNALMDAPDPDKPGKTLSRAQQPEKNGKSVKIVLNQAEMAEIRKDIDCLRRQIDAQKSLRVNHDTLSDVSFFTKELEEIKGWMRKVEVFIAEQQELRCELFVIKDEDIPNLSLQIKDLTAAVDKIQGEKKDSCIVLFQRNNYRP